MGIPGTVIFLAENQNNALAVSHIGGTFLTKPRSPMPNYKIVVIGILVLLIMSNIFYINYISDIKEKHKAKLNEERNTPTKKTTIKTITTGEGKTKGY